MASRNAYMKYIAVMAFAAAAASGAASSAGQWVAVTLQPAPEQRAAVYAAQRELRSPKVPTPLQARYYAACRARHDNIMDIAQCMSQKDISGKTLFGAFIAFGLAGCLALRHWKQSAPAACSPR